MSPDFRIKARRPIVPNEITENPCDEQDEVIEAYLRHVFGYPVTTEYQIFGIYAKDPDHACERFSMIMKNWTIVKIWPYEVSNSD